VEQPVDETFSVKVGMRFEARDRLNPGLICLSILKTFFVDFDSDFQALPMYCQSCQCLAGSLKFGSISMAGQTSTTTLPP
jgi:hypothetical protein